METLEYMFSIKATNPSHLIDSCQKATFITTNYIPFSSFLGGLSRGNTLGKKCEAQNLSHSKI